MSYPVPFPGFLAICSALSALGHLSDLVAFGRFAWYSLVLKVGCHICATHFELCFFVVCNIVGLAFLDHMHEQSPIHKPLHDLDPACISDYILIHLPKFNARYMQDRQPAAIQGSIYMLFCFLKMKLLVAILS